MNALRQDPTTGRWVVIAPDRAKRPQSSAPKAAHAPLPRYDPRCPFCPGNESALPEIIVETPREAPPQWRVRSVPNKFPALQPDAATRFVSDLSHETRPAYGFQEVIVEAPEHNADLASMTDEEIEAVVTVYRDRFRDLLHRPAIAAVIVFRNRGSQSGASLQHPHAQIAALAMVPPVTRLLAARGLSYYRDRGHCVTCDEIEREREDATRIVDDSPHFLTLVPFAAEHPGEMWIVPKRHRASFEQLDIAELQDLARHLRRSLSRMGVAYNAPPYNFVIDSADRANLDAPYFHWRLRIVPELTTWAGFELGSGIPINPSSPENDAAILRGVTETKAASTAVRNR